MLFSRTAIYKRSFLLIGFIVISASAIGQSNGVSPLTAFGLGDLSESYFAQNFGIGGASIGIREPLYINVSNPASYTALEYTTLETAVSHHFIEQTIESTDQLLNNQVTYFNYFALGFKLKEWWGMSLSISPYSFVGYNIYASDSLADFGDVLYSFKGSGGVNQAVFGNGFEPFENFSVGINVRYLFGSIDKEDAVLFNNPRYYNAKRMVSNGVSSFAFDYGAQYEWHIGDSRHLIIGANYANSIDLNARQNNVNYTFLINNKGTESPIDTAFSVLDDKGTITLPSSFGVGLSYGKKNPNYSGYAWLISGEFKSTQWSKYSNFEGSNEQLNDSWRASIGGFFIPTYAFAKSKRSRSYFSKIEYRLGGFYENTNIIMGGYNVVNYGATAGFGFPIGFRNLAANEDKSTIINFGIVVGQRGTGQPNLLNERYVNLVFGLTFGDQWFQKFKFR